MGNMARGLYNATIRYETALMWKESSMWNQVLLVSVWVRYGCRLGIPHKEMPHDRIHHRGPGYEVWGDEHLGKYANVYQSLLTYEACSHVIFSQLLINFSGAPHPIALLQQRLAFLYSKIFVFHMYVHTWAFYDSHLIVTYEFVCICDSPIECCIASCIAYHNKVMLGHNACCLFCAELTPEGGWDPWR